MSSGSRLQKHDLPPLPNFGVDRDGASVEQFERGRDAAPRPPRRESPRTITAPERAVSPRNWLRSNSQRGAANATVPNIDVESPVCTINCMLLRSLTFFCASRYLLQALLETQWSTQSFSALNTPTGPRHHHFPLYHILESRPTTYILESTPLIRLFRYTPFFTTTISLLGSYL